MGKRERRAYLEAIGARYRRASKAGKTAILNEFCAVCGYHRKYALRLLGTYHKRSNKAVHHGPTSRYNTPELVETLRTIWMASDQLCGKRLSVRCSGVFATYSHGLPFTGARRPCRCGCRITRPASTRCRLIRSLCCPRSRQPPSTACSNRFAPRPNAKVCPAPSREHCSRNTSRSRPASGM